MKFGIKKQKENNNNIDKNKEKRTINKKYLMNGSYSSMMIIVFVAIIIVINLIIGKLPSKYTEIDVSEQKLYSISDDTAEMLKNLDKDVTNVATTTE